MVNGVQPARHENGLPTKGDTDRFGDIIHLTNHGNSTNGAREKSETSMASEPILAFESEDSFMKKAGPMKPQHVAGTAQTALYRTGETTTQTCSNTLDLTLTLNREWKKGRIIKKTTCFKISNRICKHMKLKTDSKTQSQRNKNSCNMPSSLIS